jgi:hypothetical protein
MDAFDFISEYTIRYRNGAPDEDRDPDMAKRGKTMNRNS